MEINRLPNGKRYRAFFKIFFPHTSEDRLKIPLAFTMYMKENLLPNALIRDGCGNTWPVKVARIDYDFFFLDGWANYVKDNTVELGDFLVFQYDGHSVFYVKLFGNAACEKKGVGALKMKEEEGTEEVEEEEKEEEEQEQQEEMDESYMVKEEEEEEEEEGEEEEEKTTQMNEEKEEEDEEEFYSDATEMAVDSDYINEEADDSTEEEEEERPAKSSHKCFKKIERGKHESKAVKVQHHSKRHVDPYGYALFNSGHISRPKNPHFIAKIRTKRGDELLVPASIIKDYNLSLPPEIILRDQKGREWKATRKSWKDGRQWYYGGWGSLCRVNIVGDDDHCICEFKRRVDGNLFIQVRIIRPGDIAQNSK